MQYVSEWIRTSNLPGFPGKKKDIVSRSQIWDWTLLWDQQSHMAITIILINFTCYAAWLRKELGTLGNKDQTKTWEKPSFISQALKSLVVVYLHLGSLGGTCKFWYMSPIGWTWVLLLPAQITRSRFQPPKGRRQVFVGRLRKPLHL